MLLFSLLDILVKKLRSRLDVEFVLLAWCQQMRWRVTLLLFSYLETLDRGGLTWPMQELVDIVAKVFCIFQCLVSPAYEQQFLSAPNQKKIIITVSMKSFLQCSFIKYYLWLCA